MQTLPLISIIMPAYNAAKTLETAVYSALAQTYSNLELIIMDDCSTDNTYDVMNGLALKDSRIKILHHQNNEGVSCARHHCVDAARGSWLAFLDSDDAWMPDKLEKQMDLQRRTNANLLFTGSAFMDENGSQLETILHIPETIGFKRLLKQNLISNSSVLVRKSLFLQHETIKDGLHEDFACWLKILRTGEVAYGLDEPLLIYRITPTSKSGNKLKSAKMNWNTYHEIGLNVFESSYYEVCYMVNGLLKYSNLR